MCFLPNMLNNSLQVSFTPLYVNYYTVQAVEFTPKEVSRSNVTLNWTSVTEEALFYLHPHERSIFFAVYLIVYCFICLGNIAAIVATRKRKQRFFQKTCIISLALSDMVTATAIIVLSLNTFLQPIIIWTLGSFACSFLPSIPVFGVVCSSGALVGIALDRYRNVVHALKRWNPSPKFCIVSVILLWLSSAAFSSPMFIFFKEVPVIIVYYDPLHYELKHMCITFKKHELMIYYSSLICIVFIPLLTIFLWLYFKIARLVWKHRKPLSNVFNKDTPQCTSLETSTTQMRSEEYSKSTLNSNSDLKPIIKTKNTRVERKIRTFKIIVFLMCAFLMLRLPGWVFDTMKLSVKLDAHFYWVTKYTFLIFTLVGCALNPLLYTFLNNTIYVCTRIGNALKEFVIEICCCCFSATEFEQFQNTNPFMLKEPQKNKKTINNNNSNNLEIKYGNISTIKLYDPESSVTLRNYKEFKKY